MHARTERLHRLRAIVRARRATRSRTGRTTVLGAVLVLAAVGLAYRWQPLAPSRAAAARPRPGEGPVPVAPLGETAALDRMAWQWSGPSRRWSVRVLDAEFVEVARLGPTGAGATSVSVPVDVARRLQPGALYHWVVEADFEGAVARSRIASFSLGGR